MPNKDPDIHRANCQAYRQKHLKRLRAQDRKRSKEKRERAKADPAFRQKYLAMRRKAAKKYLDSHPEQRAKDAQRTRNWRKANPEAHSATKQLRGVEDLCLRQQLRPLHEMIYRVRRAALQSTDGRYGPRPTSRTSCRA